MQVLQNDTGASVSMTTLKYLTEAMNLTFATSNLTTFLIPSNSSPGTNLNISWTSSVPSSETFHSNQSALNLSADTKTTTVSTTTSYSQNTSSTSHSSLATTTSTTVTTTTAATSTTAVEIRTTKSTPSTTRQATSTETSAVLTTTTLAVPIWNTRSTTTLSVSLLFSLYF